MGGSIDRAGVAAGDRIRRVVVLRVAMLLFEFFPLFVMLVSVTVGVWLFVIDRQARRGSDE
jgi:hypothetical protein